jgi:hypothetical protein
MQVIQEFWRHLLVTAAFLALSVDERNSNSFINFNLNGTFWLAIGPTRRLAHH